MRRPQNARDSELCKRAARRGAALAAPLTEARAVLELVQRRRLTVDQARALIQVSTRDLRALEGISRHVIRRALDFRREVLAEFDAALRRRPKMKLLDRVTLHFLQSEATERDAPPRREANVMDGRDARDVLGEERVCWSCGRLPSAHVLDGHGYCRLCYPAEMNARSAAR